MVAGALPSGVANEKRRSFIIEARSWATQVIGSDDAEPDAARWPRRRAQSEPGSLARPPSLHLRPALSVAAPASSYEVARIPGCAAIGKRNAMVNLIGRPAAVATMLY